MELKTPSKRMKTIGISAISVVGFIALPAFALSMLNATETVATVDPIQAEFEKLTKDSLVIANTLKTSKETLESKKAEVALWENNVKVAQQAKEANRNAIDSLINSGLKTDKAPAVVSTVESPKVFPQAEIIQ